MEIISWVSSYDNTNLNFQWKFEWADIIVCASAELWNHS